MNHSTQTSTSPLATSQDSTAYASSIFKNVWSRSGSKYRTRAFVLLAVNVILFAGVCNFAFWLRSGEIFAPYSMTYWDDFIQTFRFWSDTPVSLGSLLVEPISVQYIPMQIPILGLLMSAMIAIPILISILYGFAFSLPFIAVVSFFAVMPWLGITLIASCILSSVRPFRSKFRFVSALWGLIPAVIYLALAWQGSFDSPLLQINPADRIKFIAPWVLAIVFSTTVFFIVLLIAKLVDYRPGAVTPLLAIMLGLPVGLFEYYVGRDELYYRLLSSHNRVSFSDVDASRGLEQAIREEMAQRPMRGQSVESMREMIEQRWLFSLASDLSREETVLVRHQSEIISRCDWFLKYFPRSPYAGNVLYLKAKAYDRRVDPVEFQQSKWIRFYDDFPNAASRESWRLLVANYPDSILSAVALLQLAKLDARMGNVDRARDELLQVLFKLDSGFKPPEGQTPPNLNQSALRIVLAPESTETSLNISRDLIILQATRLYELLAYNRDPIYNYDPISGPSRGQEPIWFGLLDIIPRSSTYVDQLRRLDAAYPNSQIQDNIALEIAKCATSSQEKITGLETCLEKFNNRDIVAETLFRLGVAYKQADQLRKSDESMARLYREYPNSIWAKEAQRFMPRPVSTQFTEARR